MVSAVETMAYANEVPWHGLGESVSDQLTPEQMLKAAQLDWSVSKEKMYLGNGKQVPGKYALVRDKDNSVLSVVGQTYKPVQNERAMSFFKQFTEAGQMTMETAGSLWDGRYVWSLARLGKDFTLGKKDEMRNYLLLASPHVHGKALVMQFTSVRVVCWNTLTFALGNSLKGGVNAFRMPHSTRFDDTVKEQAKAALELGIGQADEFKEAATLLSKKKAKSEDVEEFFCEVLQFDPKRAEKKKSGGNKEPHKLPKFRAALEYAPGVDLNTAKGTWWGALNAVTYTIDHEVGKNRNTALKNAWLGHTAGIKRRAMELALDKAS